jgi:hypothetical protein
MGLLMRRFFTSCTAQSEALTSTHNASALMFGAASRSCEFFPSICGDGLRYARTNAFLLVIRDSQNFTTNHVFLS